MDMVTLKTVTLLITIQTLDSGVLNETLQIKMITPRLS